MSNKKIPHLTWRDLQVIVQQSGSLETAGSSSAAWNMVWNPYLEGHNSRVSVSTSEKHIIFKLHYPVPKQHNVSVFLSKSGKWALMRNKLQAKPRKLLCIASSLAIAFARCNFTRLYSEDSQFALESQFSIRQSSSQMRFNFCLWRCSKIVLSWHK